MFRFVLPVALLLLTVSMGTAARTEASTTSAIQGQTTPSDLQAAQPPCPRSKGEKRACMRVLACIGDKGVFFDGQARGDGVGIILGHTSEGVQCSGHWSDVDGTDIRGEGRARLKCTDGSRFHLVYDGRDTRDGTQIGVGKDSQGRMIRAWTGDDVVHFFEDKDHKSTLKCGDRMVPLGETASID
ncbi:hypothetical protein KMP13_05100 [Epibacterium ulvae]|uniref:hypothetical protein n=1 Tax=Epibacterium ulvae TaxID=1156985 RepID=UPI001BFC893E|nr:hypothetical protein [Epibacterium ulvae]MBT8153276.1 hypothetical protein [Epibacterium ulvae]